MRLPCPPPWRRLIASSSGKRTSASATRASRSGLSCATRSLATRPRIGPYPHAVMCHLAQLHHPGGNERCHIGAEQLVERLAVILPEVRQRLVIDLHPAAQLTVCIVHIGQARVSLVRTARPVERRVKPQRQQNLRRKRRPTDPALTHPDPFVEALQILPGHIRPHQPCPMTFRQQRSSSLARNSI